MSSAERISALRGMRDVFSAELATMRKAQAALERHLRAHAYVPIELPLLENTELFLRKSGEAIAPRLYEFNFKSRRIALRPELTASVLRAYVERLQDEPLPLRIQYAGPVFRYEKPQQHRYRQFSLAGAELLGAGGSVADAEILHLACSSLEELGIRRYRLTIGHTEALEGFLRGLGLRKQLLNFLLRNMENVRKRGMPFVVESLREIYPELDLEGDHRSAEAERRQRLIDVLRGMPDDDARQAISDFLHSLKIHIDTNRDESEVIDRLLHKIREDEQAPKLRRALEYMGRLSQLAGAPDEVLTAASALVQDFGMERRTLDALGAILEKLALFGDLDAEIRLDLGLNRGLHYYTGLIFEISAIASSGDALQLGGGGRYDNLITVLGGSEATPAAGFALGLERVAGLLGGGAPSLNRADVAVIPIAEADLADGIAAAQRLRKRGLVVDLSIAGRSLRRSLKHAHRKGAAIVIIVGERERQQGQLVLRDMRQHRELRIAGVDLESAVEGLLATDE